ncbi:MAG: NAD(P)/FAD-dependent oxidoreductase [Planctomycetota bacterium]
MRRYDVIVIGAGVAGTLAAREIARRGRRVLLIERETFPREKVCGGCIGPVALDALSEAGLGDLPERCGAVPVSTFEWSARGRTARMPLAGGAVLTRSVLDAALLDSAVDAGVDVLQGVSAQSRGVSVALSDGRSIEAGLVVGATGLGGGEVVRASLLGAGAVLDSAGQGYEPGTIHMAHGHDGYVGSAIAEDRRLVVAVALTQAAAKQHGIAGAVARILHEAGRPALPEDVPWRGTPLLTRRPLRPYGERLLLLGDAAGYVEPFTGEGIGWAMRAALALAPLAASGWSADLGEQWQAELDALVLRPQRRCRMVTRALRWPGASSLAVAALRLFPSMAPRVVRSATAWASTS